MLITDLQLTTSESRVRASADVVWEDCDRPQREIYFETEASFADSISPHPNAFLLAAFVPAVHHGERRIRVQGKLCPQLRDGVTVAMRLLRGWCGEQNHKPAAIEASIGFEAPLPCTPSGTASTMSGGVDALITLRSNRLNFPLDHPLSIRTCFLAYGIDIGGYEELPGSLPHFDHMRDVLSAFSRQEDFTLVPVYTNMRHLDDSDALFGTDWFGAAIAAIAHAFAPRIGRMHIPSGNSIDEQQPQGSHPLLDPNYSSGQLQIVHDGFGLSRLEKVGLLSNWDEALPILRSCYAPFRSDTVVNCGTCEKCLRTMTELLVHGTLNRCPTFPLDDIVPETLRPLGTIPSPKKTQSREASLRDLSPFLTIHTVQMWEELIAPLRGIGRDDLADTIQERIRRAKLQGVLRYYFRRAVVRGLRLAGWR